MRLVKSVVLCVTRVAECPYDVSLIEDGRKILRLDLYFLFDENKQYECEYHNTTVSDKSHDERLEASIAGFATVVSGNLDSAHSNEGADPSEHVSYIGQFLGSS